MERPLRSDRYPWYDSGWITRYEKAKATIALVQPDALSTFVDAFRVLRTRPDFEVQHVPRIFDDAVLADIRRAIETLRPSDLTLDEGAMFGRFLVRNQRLFTELQARALPRVERTVGEPLVASYNFLSLYAGRGVCPVHMDAPDAKWTLDLCIQQSQPWPLYLSQVRPWPTADEVWPDANWAEAIKKSPDNRFSEFTLHPGESLVFSGSSQWHYREAMPGTAAKRFCDLLFFHFVPAGAMDIVDPGQWARLFGIPALKALAPDS